MSPTLYKVCMILVLIGAINWGLVAILNWNAVDWVNGVLGDTKKTIAKIVYIIVGLAGIALVFEPRILSQ